MNKKYPLWHNFTMVTVLDTWQTHSSISRRLHPLLDCMGILITFFGLWNLHAAQLDEPTQICGDSSVYKGSISHCPISLQLSGSLPYDCAIFCRHLKCLKSARPLPGLSLGTVPHAYCFKCPLQGKVFSVVVWGKAPGPSVVCQVSAFFSTMPVGQGIDSCRN